ncbi:MAG: FHA domain-containing protein [Prevotella sp.]|nr:FHA domain-containing protein [Prevotella sp.]
MEKNINISNSPKKEIPQLGIPQKVEGKEKLYIIKEKVCVGNIYKVHCPDCGFEMAKKIQNTGIHKHICPKCKTIIGFNAVEKTAMVKSETKKEEQPQQEQERKVTQSFKTDTTSLGEIVWGGMFSQKHHRIGKETVTIGRKDIDEPSTISLDDDFVSRRSAIIEPILADKGTIFKFTVLKASNPVFVNGHEMMIGNSIYLNYGDTIKLGKTTLTFKKVKK